MLKVENTNTSNINTQQTNQKKMSFLRKTDNKLEQTPSSDNYEKQSKDNKKKIITLSLIGATVVVALIEGIAYKCKHINKLFKKAKNEAKKTNATTQTIEKEVEKAKNEIEKAKKNLIQADENLAEIKKISNTNMVHNSSDDSLDYIEYFDKNRKKIAEVHYTPSGKSIFHIDNYDKEEKLAKRTFYHDNGNTINRTNVYDKNEILVKEIYYSDNGKEISSIYEYNDNKLTKKIFCNNDGETIHSITEYRQDGKSKTTVFKDDGTIDFEY